MPLLNKRFSKGAVVVAEHRDMAMVSFAVASGPAVPLILDRETAADLAACLASFLKSVGKGVFIAETGVVAEWEEEGGGPIKTG